MPQVRFENLIHGFLKCGRSIREPKRHDNTLIVAIISADCCFVYISPIHANLLITSAQI